MEDERKKYIEGLKYGDVIHYYSKKSDIEGKSDIDRYLVVHSVEQGRISGRVVIPFGINSVSIDDLLTPDIELKVADFKDV